MLCNSLKLSSVLLFIGALLSHQTASAEEAQSVAPFANDVVATCGAIQGYPSYRFSIARNNLGAYDLYIQNGDTGSTSVKRNWEGSITPDRIAFADPSHPSIGSIRAYRSSDEDRYEGGLTVLDIGDLREGRRVWCEVPERERSIISCINNVLNDSLHSVDIYAYGSSYQMKIKFLDGDELSHLAIGDVDVSSIWMFGNGWELDVSWRPNFWWGPLTGPDGRSNDMVCFR